MNLNGTRNVKLMQAPSNGQIRIAAISDVHFPDNRTATENSIARIKAQGTIDVLIVAGDTSNGVIGDTSTFLNMLNRKIDARYKLIIPGNHDLWSTNGSSLESVISQFNQVCNSLGYYNLENGPAVMGDFGFVGNIGWYDFSFRPSLKSDPVVFIPNLSGKLVEKKYSQMTLSDFEGQIYYTPTRINGKDGYHMEEWNDHRFVKKSSSDVSFCDSKIRQLEQDINSVKGKAKKIIAVTHTVPHINGVAKYAWPETPLAAYHGTDKLRRLYERQNVLLAIYGHEHSHQETFQDRGVTYAHSAVNMSGKVPVYVLK